MKAPNLLMLIECVSFLAVVLLAGSAGHNTQQQE
jgi:hypothetical protein